MRPSQGKVELEGAAITGLAPHKLARLGIGYVPEDRRIFRLLTVMENLRTGLDRQEVTAVHVPHDGFRQKLRVAGQGSLLGLRRGAAGELSALPDAAGNAGRLVCLATHPGARSREMAP